MSKQLVLELKKKFHDYKFLLSFISPSGYENSDINKFDCVIYLPLETNYNCKKFYNTIVPKITIFIKNEIWPNYIKYAKINGSKVYSVGGNFKPNILKSLTNINSGIKQFDKLFVVNKSSKELIEKIGNNKVIICGDLRFDSIIKGLNKENTKIIKDFIGDKNCIVFGSTWKEDENLIIRFINESKRDLKYIIAPHEVSKRCSKIKNLIDKKSILFSEIISNFSTKDIDCLIIDNIGILSSLYYYSTIAYVGGGMGSNGLHNTLEPAYFSKPIIIGKNYKGFDEAEDMIKNEGMISVSDYIEFNNSLNGLLGNEKIINKMAENNYNYFTNNKGGLKLVLNNI